jgi:hyaluronate lyase
MVVASRAGIMLAALLSAGLHGAAHADVYDDLRAKWIARPASAPPLAPDDPDVAMQQAATAAAPNYYTTLDQSAGRTSLWPDLPLGSVSANLTTSVSRLAAMMKSYNDPASPNYQVAAVRQAALGALDWLIANAYTATGTGYDNWYDWQIGTPQALNNLMMSWYADLTPVQVANVCAAIDHYMPDPTVRAAMDGSIAANALVETGANRLDKALVAVLRGILGKDGGKIGAGRDAISAALPYVTTGDGNYVDGTFVQHTYVPYVGGYGTVLLNDINKLYYILDGSNWPISGDPNYGKPFEWAMNAYRPFIVDGAMMDNQRGRGIARQYSQDHVVGRNTVFSLAELAQVLPADQALQLKGLIKGWVRRDTTFGSSYFTPVPASPTTMQTISTYDIALVKAILADGSIPATPEAVEARVFPSGDRAVLRGDGFAYALSLFSPRISAFEYGNGENLRGWWTGVGMTTLHNADLAQYSNDYWATVDPLRLAGTTTDRSGSGTPVAWKKYANTKNVVGGAALLQFATVAMEFALSGVTGTSLTGKKAWFLFGDRIVAVGAGIGSTNGVEIETIVDNRMLDADGDNALTVGDAVKPATPGWSEAMAATRWAHLAGNTATGSDIGYVFPDQPTVNALRETRTGAWRDVNTGGTTTAIGRSYLSLSLSHGSNPAAGSYTYIVLPNRSAAETAAFAAANPVAVIERSTTATAVRDGAQGVTGIVFWTDAAKTVSVAGQPYLTSDRKAVVTIRQAGTDVQLAVADPTQTNTGTINLELYKSATAVIGCDPGVTVTQQAPTIRLAVAVTAAAGKSFTCRFTANDVMTLYPAADSFVRDGTYAATNYGTTTYVTIKNDAAGYQRKGLLKFNLAGVPGTIDSATLKLTATAAGTGGITHNLYRTATDGWTETGVTWNTRPANGGLLASYAVPAPNAAVQVDVTSAATAVMTGTKLLSLGVEAAANYGSNGAVDYASKEHANAGYRPALVVTYH